MAYKRYDMQDQQKPAYLYAGHNYTKLKYYNDKIQAYIDTADKTEIGNIRCFVLLECAELLFNSATLVNILSGKTELKATKQEYNRLYGDVEKQFNEQVAPTIKLPVAFLVLALRELYTINGMEEKQLTEYAGDYAQHTKNYTDNGLPEITGIISSITSNLEENNARLLQAQVDIDELNGLDELTEKQKIALQFERETETATQELINNYTELKEQAINLCYKTLQDFIDRHAEQKTRIQELYKHTNAHNIYIDILADVLQVDELKVYKYDLYFCRKLLEKANERTQELIDELNGIIEDNAVNDDFTKNITAYRNKIGKLLFVIPNRNLRPPTLTINKAIDLVSNIDFNAYTRDDYIHIYGILAGLYED